MRSITDIVLVRTTGEMGSIRVFVIAPKGLNIPAWHEVPGNRSRRIQSPEGAIYADQ